MKNDMMNLMKDCVVDLELSELTRSLMAGVRKHHECDEETLERIVKEYEDCKYGRKMIPGAEKYWTSCKSE